MIYKIGLIILITGMTSLYFKKNNQENQQRIKEIKHLTTQTKKSIDETKKRVLNDLKNSIQKVADKEIIKVKNEKFHLIETEEVNEQFPLIETPVDKHNQVENKVIELINKGFSNRKIKRLSNQRRKYIKKLRKEVLRNHSLLQ